MTPTFAFFAVVVFTSFFLREFREIRFKFRGVQTKLSAQFGSSGVYWVANFLVIGMILLITIYCVNENHLISGVMVSNIIAIILGVLYDTFSPEAKMGLLAKPLSTQYTNSKTNIIKNSIP